jgi:2-oxoglutarate ferredoxin oxidoreductase subunit beta
VEILSQCPTDWALTPLQAIKKIQDEMIPYYPLGEFKNPEETKKRT